MINIYIAAYKNFGDYRMLSKVCNYMLSRLNKNDVTFFATTGESGDNTCMKYIRDNGYNYIDWIPQKRGHSRAKEKLEFIRKSNHAILVTNGCSEGILIASRYAGKHVSGKIVIIDAPANKFTVYEGGVCKGEVNINNI